MIAVWNMSGRWGVIVVLLAVLVLLPPLAMAYHNCSGMSQMCEAPCGAMVGAVVVPTTSAAPDLIASLALEPAPQLPAINAPSPDPPPKSLLLAA